MAIKRLIIILSVLLFCTSEAMAANHYVLSSASGSATGADWTNAYTALPAALTRGDTYYVGSGTYTKYTFDDAVDGTKVITIKKATIADHGTDTGWSSEHAGQALFTHATEATIIGFETGYYVFDGNGTHTTPSDTASDYGFKVSSDIGECSTCTSAMGTGTVNITSGSNVTIKYTHIYNTHNGNDGNVPAVSMKFVSTPTYVKVQNCFLENSGRDGISLSSASYILFERNYIKKLGLAVSPGEMTDVHGQVVQLFYGGDDIIFRYNKWEANQGQGLISIAGIGDGLEAPTSKTERVRFYGNIVYSKYGETTATYGLNNGGGLIGNSWEGCDSTLTSTKYGHTGIYVYNNTFVNVGGDYATGSAQWQVATFPAGASYTTEEGDSYYAYCPGWTTTKTEEYGYNNIFYNNGGTTGATGWTAWDYNATGECGDDGTSVYGGANEQTGIASSIFVSYTGNDFRLATNTNGGLDLTEQPWWSGGADAFFGTLDSALDMSGTTRASWSRGAYEANSGYKNLTVTIGGNATGESVSSSPAGISCGATCDFDFDDDTEVTITATYPDNRKVTWGGTDGGACTGSTCTVTMSAAKAVTATFSNLTGQSTLGGSGAAVLGGSGQATITR